MKNGRKNIGKLVIFEGRNLEKPSFSLGYTMILTFSMFRNKSQKNMKNGAQQVSKIHEKSTMGRPSVDFSPILGVLERGQKHMIF